MLGEALVNISVLLGAERYRARNEMREVMDFVRNLYYVSNS